MQNCLSTTTAGPTTTSPTEGFFDYGPCDSGDKSCLLFPPGCGDFRNCSVVASWKLLGSDAIEIESQCLYTEASGLSYVGAGITADNTTENSATFVLSGNYTLGDYSAESLVSELISGILRCWRWDSFGFHQPNLCLVFLQYFSSPAFIATPVLYLLFSINLRFCRSI